MHFYDDELNCYDVGIKEAREKGLYPSVTTILGDMPRYHLERYNRNAIIECAADLRGVMNTRDFKLATWRAFCEYGEEAREFGTRKHQILEDNAELLNEPETLKEYAEMFECKELLVVSELIGHPSTVEAEKTFLSKDIGVAGTADLVVTDTNGNNYIIDYKFQSTEKDIVFFDDYFFQLLLLEEIAFMPNASLISIKTSIDGNIKYKVWKNDERKGRLKSAVLGFVPVWKNLKNFNHV